MITTPHQFSFPASPALPTSGLTPVLCHLLVENVIYMIIVYCLVQLTQGNQSRRGIKSVGSSCHFLFQSPSLYYNIIENGHHFIPVILSQLIFHWLYSQSSSSESIYFKFCLCPSSVQKRNIVAELIKSQRSMARKEANFL